MTTFTMQDLNNIEVTKEEEEMMEKLSKLSALEGVALVGQTIAENSMKEAQMGEVLPNELPSLEATPALETILATIGEQFALLATVINKQKGNSLNAEDQSLQDCVSATLEQAEWFKEMVAEKAEELVDDKDFEYEIGEHIERYFRNQFSLDDHVDIHAEIESKVEDIVERIVEDKLSEVVEEALRNASIRINF